VTKQANYDVAGQQCLKCQSGVCRETSRRQSVRQRVPSDVEGCCRFTHDAGDFRVLSTDSDRKHEECVNIETHVESYLLIVFGKLSVAISCGSTSQIY
jgi:hypothetical protein